MIVDGLGRAYVGDLGFDMPPPPDRGAVGRIILVMPDGAHASSRRTFCKVGKGVLHAVPTVTYRQLWRSSWLAGECLPQR